MSGQAILITFSRQSIALSVTLATISAPTPQVTHISSAVTRRAAFFTDDRMESVSSGTSVLGEELSAAYDSHSVGRQLSTPH
jgi:hypothetical protein